MIIHWFRRDLRLHDNTALAAAARDSGGAVAPLFIFDDALLGGRWASPARTTFMLESLRALDVAMRKRGSALIVRRGDPLAELLGLARELGASGVYWNRDYSPYAIRRDSAIKAALKEVGVEARSFKDAVVFEMGELLTEQSRPYTVYTPYSRRWRRRLAEVGFTVQEPPELVSLGTLPQSTAQHLPSIADLGMQTAQAVPPGGEQVGRELLYSFATAQGQHGIAGYATGRDQLALPATSRLSPHLRLGTVSVRECLRAAMDADEGPKTKGEANLSADGAAIWIGELIWRDFYVQVLYHHPHVLRGSFKPEFDQIGWENDQALFEAWKAGKTGYPVVDAAMRQLAKDAWMHNRARMIVASFLTKELLIDWRWGEAHFMHMLVDGDPAANNGGWQWAAGTGTDAQPYFRIFNPTSQGQKFDPAGAYVRRYVPELANLPDSFIHEPWKMSPEVQRLYGVQIGHDYPAPIVDHAVQRQRALDLYAVVKKPSTAD